MNQPRSVADYLSLLEPDEWRARVGFSPEVEAVNRELFHPGLPEEDAARMLGKWLERYQPCLFGRIAARAGALGYCILSENELHRSDEFIKDKIQARRLEWTREGFEGRKSGFIILAVSQALAWARPGPEVQELARRLCYLYLETDIEMDEIHTDQLYLQKPSSRLTTWRWLTGVNYFSAQGDGRWWQDHRIPGGMAFSVNSVGHLVKSGIVAKAMRGLDESTGAPFEDYPEPKVDSLDKALELAMRTIGMASDAVSGKATELLPLPLDRGSLPITECPVKLSDKVADKNFCEYRGYYHTDYTLPSEYFLPDVERTAGVQSHTLDFTYLFHRDVDNPDFRLMGEGQTHIPGTLFTFFVPYKGEQELFKCRPSAYNHNPPHARIKPGELELAYAVTEQNSASIRAQFDRDLAQIRQWLAWVANDVAQFNGTVRAKARARVEARKQRLENDRDTASGIGFPSRRGSGRH